VRSWRRVTRSPALVRSRRGEPEGDRSKQTPGLSGVGSSTEWSAATVFRHHPHVGTRSSATSGSGFRNRERAADCAGRSSRGDIAPSHSLTRQVHVVGPGMKTRAGERAHRRHARRSWLPEAELIDQDGRRSSGSAVRLPKTFTLFPTAACARGAASRVHRPSCAAAAASPRAIARSRPRDCQVWDLRLNGRLRPCFDIILTWRHDHQPHRVRGFETENARLIVPADPHVEISHQATL
jgi:hypothetical protein